MTKARYQIVGHRGWPQQCPENSIRGVVEAITAGVHAEIDVQLSADAIPLVIHDPNTLRTSGTDCEVLTSDYTELAHIVCDEEKRLGKSDKDAVLPRLDTLAHRVAGIISPGQRLFIEIKEHSIDKFGIEQTFAAILPAMEQLSENAVFISFHYDFLRYVKSRCDIPVGWVLESFDGSCREQAVALAPQYLIIDCNEIPKHTALWNYNSIDIQNRGVDGTPWQWFIYDVCDPLQAAEWFDRGVSYIESWDFKAL